MGSLLLSFKTPEGRAESVAMAVVWLHEAIESAANRKNNWQTNWQLKPCEENI